jgi:AraC family transcriptional regulator
MLPEITTSPEKKLIGMRLKMSFVDYKVRELWKSFMPRRREIGNLEGSDMFSVAVYAPGHFENFNPANEFERWAAVEVTGFNNLPPGMEAFILPAGLYAVFHYTGLNSDTSIFHYILGTWLPGSDYELDHRPHFEVLGDKYKNNDPASEEQIWIPIKPKSPLFS